MAGTSDPQAGFWPFGSTYGGGTIPIRMNFVATTLNTGGAFKNADGFTAKFDFDIVAAEMQCLPGFTLAGTSAKLKIVDDTGSPQTIVASRDFVAADDDGTIVALTVADKGPILTGGVVYLQYQGAAGDTILGCGVTLHIRPRFPRTQQ
jgi:hypothetical protein